MRKRGIRDDPQGFPWVIGRASLPSGAGRWKRLQDDLFKCGCSGKVLSWIQAPSLWVGHMVDAMTFNGQLFSSNQPPPPTPHISLGPAALRRSLCWSLAALPSLRCPRSSSLWRRWAQEDAVLCAFRGVRTWGWCPYHAFPPYLPLRSPQGLDQWEQVCSSRGSTDFHLGIEMAVSPPEFIGSSHGPCFPSSREGQLVAFSLREGQHLFENDMFSQRHLLPDCSPLLDLLSSGPRLLCRWWWRWEGWS